MLASLVLTSDASTMTGSFLIDDVIRRQAGVTDFARYSVVPGGPELLPDLFL